MDYQDMYNMLKKEFQDTFIEELVPGIVHNFANPLNGIMGRSRLLQRKLTEIMKKTDAEKDASYIEYNQKLVHDVESIAREFLPIGVDGIGDVFRHAAFDCTFDEFPAMLLDVLLLLLGDRLAQLIRLRR